MLGTSEAGRPGGQEFQEVRRSGDHDSGLRSHGDLGFISQGSENHEVRSSECQKFRGPNTGCRPAPPSSPRGKAGKNHLNEEINPHYSEGPGLKRFGG
jgi:hypothetical protein